MSLSCRLLSVVRLLPRSNEIVVCFSHLEPEFVVRWNDIVPWDCNWKRKKEKKSSERGRGGEATSSNETKEKVRIAICGAVSRAAQFLSFRLIPSVDCRNRIHSVSFRPMLSDGTLIRVLIKFTVVQLITVALHLFSINKREKLSVLASTLEFAATRQTKKIVMPSSLSLTPWAMCNDGKAKFLNFTLQSELTNLCRQFTFTDRLSAGLLTFRSSQKLATYAHDDDGQSQLSTAERRRVQKTHKKPCSCQKFHLSRWK